MLPVARAVGHKITTIEGLDPEGGHPHKMVFIGLSGGELCRGLLNKAENGGRDLHALREHLDDKLVL